MYYAISRKVHSWSHTHPEKQVASTVSFTVLPECVISPDCTRGRSSFNTSQKSLKFKWDYSFISGVICNRAIPGYHMPESNL